MRLLCVAIAIGTLPPLFSQAIPQAGDWPAYGRDPGGMRYSPLDQINTKNVAQAGARLDLSHAGARPVLREHAHRCRRRACTCRPHTQKVIALEPETGSEIWRYDAQGAAAARHRGVSYWPGDAQTSARILFGTGDGRLIALDAKTGVPVHRLRRQRRGQPPGRRYRRLSASRLRHHIAAQPSIATW